MASNKIFLNRHIFKYCVDYPVHLNIWNSYSYYRFMIEKIDYDFIRVYEGDFPFHMDAAIRHETDRLCSLQ